MTVEKLALIGQSWLLPVLSALSAVDSLLTLSEVMGTLVVSSTLGPLIPLGFVEYEHVISLPIRHHGRFANPFVCDQSWRNASIVTAQGSSLHL